MFGIMNCGTILSQLVLKILNLITLFFIYSHEGMIIYLLVYFDDLIITENSPNIIDQFIKQLGNHFSIKVFGILQLFLGVEALHKSTGLFLSQKKYITDLLEQSNMVGDNLISTPMSPSGHLSLADSPHLTDLSEYRQVVGSLQYLSLARLNITFVVDCLSQFMHQTITNHWATIKRLLCYIKGSIGQGIFLCKNSPLSLHAFSSVD